MKVVINAAKALVWNAVDFKSKVALNANLRKHTY